MASALRTCSTVVQVVHDLVRDTLAQLVGAIISWVSTLVMTAGLATPYVASQVATRVSSIATRVGRSVIDVISTGKSLKNLLEAMKDALAQLASGVRRGAPGPARTTVSAVPTSRPGTHPSGLPYSAGEMRDRPTQLADPQIHPDNANIVESWYDPWAGRSRQEFLAEFEIKDPVTQQGEWIWPRDDGKVPGTTSIRPIAADEVLTLDRIGGDTGAFYGDPDTPFSQLALPPDRLGFNRDRFTVDTSNEYIASGQIQIETSQIAPAFGQQGGAPQHRFVMDGRIVEAWELKGLGVFGSEFVGGSE